MLVVTCMSLLLLTCVLVLTLDDTELCESGPVLLLVPVESVLATGPEPSAAALLEPLLTLTEALTLLLLLAEPELALPALVLPAVKALPVVATCGLLVVADTWLRLSRSTRLDTCE